MLQLWGYSLHHIWMYGWEATYRYPKRGYFWDGTNINYLRKGTPVLWRGVPMGKKEEKVQSRCFTTLSSKDWMEIAYS